MFLCLVIIVCGNDGDEDDEYVEDACRLSYHETEEQEFRTGDNIFGNDGGDYDDDYDDDCDDVEGPRVIDHGSSD